MTTLATLKTRIASDLERSDMGTQIAECISDAITYYQSERFYFNETRSVTFSTVASQREYTSTDEANIPKFIKLDAVIATVSGNARELCWTDPVVMELLHDSNVTAGQPSDYAYYDQSLSIYPLPDQAYTIRLMGHIKKAEPASDSEANNVWMTEGFELIRARAKLYFAIHTGVDDGTLAANAARAEVIALERLQRETARRVGTGRFIPTQF